MNVRSSIKVAGITATFLFLGIAASFYLFVLPALVATASLPASGVEIWFAAFLYAQLWMLALEYAYMSAAGLYGFRRRSLIPYFDHLLQIYGTARSGLGVLLACTLSYLVAVYGFAIAYAYISANDAEAFSVPRLSLLDASYFSLVTATTTGYGDIAPRSSIAKVFVMMEIVMSLGYAVFFFSVVGSAIREREPR